MDDFNRKLKTELPLDVADTLGGFIINSLGRIPASDERIDTHGLTFIIYEKVGYRIRRVKVIKHKGKTE